MPDFGFDNWIDAQLRNVPLPPDFLSRLAESGPSRDGATADARLDASLRDVPVPGYLESRLRRIARPKVAPFWRHLALAASLFLMVGLGGVGFLAIFTHSLAPLEITVAQSSADLTGTQTPSQVEEPVLSPATKIVAKEPARQAPPAPVATTAEVGSVSLPTLADVAAFGATLKQTMNAKLRTQSALGADARAERLPELDALDSSRPYGVSPPRVPGYDLLFQLKHGEHPFVSPSSHKELGFSRMPFSFRTTSYDLAVRGAKSGQTRPADEARVEEFLAAQDYPLPAAPVSGLALHAAGSTSPVGDAHVKLLQLAVQAAASHAQAHPPARLIAVVEMSTRMRLGAHWHAVRQALDKLARKMAPADRITLIGYGEQARVLAQDASGREIQALLASESLPQPAGSANFASAVDSAVAAARALKSPATRRIVLIAASPAELDDTAQRRAAQSLGELANSKIRWEMICAGAAGADSQCNELAEVGHGHATVANSAVEIYDALIEQLLGRSLTAARGVSLKLTFNPQVVTGYRLMGHEVATLTGAAGDPVEIDLHADQSAIGMYELWMKPSGGDLVATAELTWREPVNDQPRHLSQPIRRGMFAESFSKATPWLQQGIVAAKAAEALRGSYYAEGQHPIGQILELANQTDARVRERPGFQQLLSVIKSADRAR